MDKKSVIYAAGALVIILVIAIVVKPMATGQPLNTGLPVATTLEPVTSPTWSPGVTPTLVPPPSSSTPIPAVIPTWDRNVMTIGFVDPSTYGLTLGNPLPNGTRFDPNPVNTSTTSFAKISGRFSGTTGIIKIPFPYWELLYTVDPVTPTEPGSVTGGTHSGVQGSYSGVMPEFTVQVFDARDPNRIVRTFSPPGGINQDLWKTNDPRPWTEKFYEGQKSYYFIITSKLLNSYSIDIRIPTKYIGVY